jgi:hypothetical protein
MSVSRLGQACLTAPFASKRTGQGYESFGYSSGRNVSRGAMHGVICRDHTHPFNEEVYIPSPCMGSMMNFDADDSGFSSCRNEECGLGLSTVRH